MKDSKNENADVIVITETLQKTVVLKKGGRDKVVELYEKGEIVLSSEDFIGVTIESDGRCEYEKFYDGEERSYNGETFKVY